jgi:4-hydroxybenzoate polyprenyltransferase
VSILRGVVVGSVIGGILIAWAACIGLIWAILTGRLDRWWDRAEDRAVRRIRERMQAQERAR